MRLERIERPRANILRLVKHETAALWLLVLIAPALFLVPITHDEIWHIWIGQQLLHGARLYHDIVEVNPPLWFWIGVPLAWTGIEPKLAVIAFFVVSMSLSLCLCPPPHRLAALVTFAILPLADFGQREHFALIASAPYVFLIGKRADNEPPKHPILIGLFAAIGFALKPYFAIVPLALEMMVRKRVRPEIIAIVAFAVSYAISVLIFTPEYLTTMLPMLKDAYGSFGGDNALVFASLAFLVAAAGAVLGRRSGNGTTRVLLLAAVAFLVAAAVQAKGWTYQTLPARGFLFLCVCAELARFRRKPIADALMVAGAMLCFWPIGVYRNDFSAEMEQHLSGIPRGSSIVVLANNPSFSWPVVYERGLKWDLPEMSAWQIQALFHSQRSRADAQRLVNIGLAKRPDLIVVDIRPWIIGPTMSLMPHGYLSGYVPRLRSKSMQSYIRRDFSRRLEAQ